ncbi:hypothetical protein Y032_0672g1385 [Ancylostoma ceylanicum]|nr:hypothetical protein Y032_0672g1385 [Ancylostoma ceylanicum]
MDFNGFLRLLVESSLRYVRPKMAITAVISWWKPSRKEKPIGPALTFRPQHANSPIRHFTKIAWANTREIGCAVKECGSFFFAVCHYNPGGNLLNQKIYLDGSPCTSCPQNAKCSQGLCVV